jgi:hypothetical protein
MSHDGQKDIFQIKLIRMQQTSQYKDGEWLEK